MRSNTLWPFAGFLMAAGLAAVLVPAAPSAAQECGDVNGSGTVTTSDALGVLRVAVGQPVELICSGECSEIEPRVTTLESALATALDQIEALQAVLEGVSRTDDALVISGANLQVVDGSGSTAGPTNGLGNVIIGYHEALPDREQTGSHNLVVGVQHEYTSFAGIVAGERNTIAAPSVSVLGGKDNIASEDLSAVVGGSGNHASGSYSVVCGGSLNLASGSYAAVGGGFDNEASGVNSAVSGGCENMATFNFASVSGGRSGVASGEFSSVQGGHTNQATGSYTSVSGGANRTASLPNEWKAGGLTQPN